MGVYVPLEISTVGSLPDDLVGSLLGDVTTPSGSEKVVIPLQSPFLCVEQDGSHKSILNEDHPFHISLPPHPYTVPTYILKLDSDCLRNPHASFP